jgi:hypothetical protein
MLMTERRPRIGSPGFPGLWACWKRFSDGDLVEDIVYWHDKHKVDGHLLHTHLSPLLEELERRGFDTKTFRMSIERKREVTGG